MIVNCRTLRFQDRSLLSEIAMHTLIVQRIESDSIVYVAINDEHMHVFARRVNNTDAMLKTCSKLERSHALQSPDIHAMAQGVIQQAIQEVPMSYELLRRMIHYKRHGHE